MSAVAKVHTKVLFDLKSELSKQNRTKQIPSTAGEQTPAVLYICY